MHIVCLCGNHLTTTFIEQIRCILFNFLPDVRTTPVVVSSIVKVAHKKASLTQDLNITHIIFYEHNVIHPFTLSDTTHMSIKTQLMSGGMLRIHIKSKEEY